MKYLLQKFNFATLKKGIEVENINLEQTELLETENIDIWETNLTASKQPETVINTDQMELAGLILKALGGKENVTSIDACVTRLRLEVKNSIIVDETVISKLGAAKVLKIGNNGIQAIFGSKAKVLAEELKKL